VTVAVVNLGVGNTASVMFALERLGVRARLTADADEIAEADRVILPGVGAAPYAMARIDDGGLRQCLASFPRPLLGICLGQQLLFERSEEGNAAGLGLLAGTVTKLAPPKGEPSPHMGWNQLEVKRSSPLLEGVRSGDYVYFVHGFICPVTNDSIAVSHYGALFASMVGAGAIFGCQFHPERSGPVGARILNNFLALPC
jgi:glutamine amidotransferase